MASTDASRATAVRRLVLVGVAVLALTAVVVNHYFPAPERRDVWRQTPLPAAVVRDAGCPEDASEMPTHRMDGIVGDGAVPPGFQPQLLLRCHLSETHADGSRSTYRVVEERARSLPTDLLELLALPDQRYTDPRVACDLLPRPWVVMSLVDAGGNAVVPRLPRESCGDPRPDVAAVLEALDWQPVSSRTIDVPT